jgi:hypothetical protein
MAVVICYRTVYLYTVYYDTDPNFHVDAEPDPEWHHKRRNPHADPTPSFTHFGKLLQKVFLVTALPQYDVQYGIFLVSVKCVLLFWYLESWTAY